MIYNTGIVFYPWYKTKAALEVGYNVQSREQLRSALRHNLHFHAGLLMTHR